MKKDIHPRLNEVVFQDKSADFAFKTLSTVRSNETIKWEDGKEYPLVSLEISSASHPVFTGQQRMIDTQGRVQKFQEKYARAAKRTTKKSKKVK